jgi:formylglycine-generating enzyme required for sulfatase activity
MRARTSTPAAVFEKVLGAFRTGGFNYADFLKQSKHLVDNAASPTELLEVLERFEWVEPLPEYAHAEVLGFLNDAIGRAAVQNPNPDGAADQFPDSPPAAPADEEVTIDLAHLQGLGEDSEDDEADYFSPRSHRAELTSTSAALSEFVRPTVDVPSLAGHVRALDEQIARQKADNEELTRSIERARAAESAAATRGAALEAELAAARDAFESERRKTRDLDRALAERNALLDAANSRSEEALRATERSQTEARTLRDSLAARDTARDAALSQARRALAERESQLEALQREHTTLVPTLEALQREHATLVPTLEALQREHATLVSTFEALHQEQAKWAPALEARTKSGTQLEADLSAARAGASALAADLTAARAALEAEQRKSRDLDQALAESAAGLEAANSRSDEALRASERSQTESRTLRDSLAARDAALAQARRVLAERDAQLATLQQEHAKMLPALDARAKAGTQLQADLQTALARAEAISLELKAAEAARAELSAQLKRSEELLNAAVIELGAVKAKESSHLELLRTREWRNGFHHNTVRELDARADAAGAGHRTALTERDQLRAQLADLQSKLDAREALVDELRSAAVSRDAARAIARDAPRATERDSQRVTVLRAAPPVRDSEEAAKSAPLAKPEEPKAARPAVAPPARGGSWNGRAAARALGVSAAVIAVAAVVWFFVHPKPVPPPAPVVPAAVLPNPGTVIRDCPTCPAMTVLAAGRFKQGSDSPESAAEPFAKPSHWVAIGRPFAMATNAVTVDEFQKFATDTAVDMQGCDTYDGGWKHRAKNSWKSPGFAQTGTHPVTCVSWNDAKAYASWLSRKTGHGYRLPSASEWEYAARAGGAGVQPWTADGSDACANANVADESAAHKYPGWAVFGCNDGYVYTAPVGSFKNNSMGLNDMLGNVFQWTEDCWSPDYTGAPTDGSARSDGDCSEHELRGGSWYSTPAYVKANYRNHFAADYRTSSVGIRLVRDIEQ